MGLRHRACVAVSHPRERHVEAELCLLWVHVPVGAVSGEGSILEGPLHTFLGVEDIWNSQGGF